MIPADTITAATMTATSSTMPTAVITESSENTMSSSMIWTITLAKDAAPAPAGVVLLPLEPLVHLERALAEEEQPAADQDQVAARDRAADQR